MIAVKDATLKYSNGKGIFDLNFKVQKGEVFGCMGPESAGKTTTISMLMGFSRLNKGVATIAGLNCAKKAATIKKNLGYIPGELAFFENMRVNEFLNFMAHMRGKTQKNQKIREALIERFELETRGKIERLSIEMKQKLAIVTAFMHDPEVLLLDEPTSNLDPRMQTRFVDLILEEKKRGKTILIASQKFGEIERTCDRVAVIKEGHIVEQNEAIKLKSAETKSYLVKFGAPPNLEELKRYGFGFKKLAENNYEITAAGDHIDLLVKVLSKEKVIVFNSNAQTLEEIFLKYYGKEMQKA
ncbi:MAG: ABC transporter ATP-binding protein [Eubacteriaceae bacterium]|nr:ABC transporter ATP-binding protein [Eubacteriaceae bacterium]